MDSPFDAVFLVALGLYFLVAAWFDWEWHWRMWSNSIRSGWLAEALGRNGIRVLCLLVGLGCVVVGYSRIFGG